MHHAKKKIQVYKQLNQEEHCIGGWHTATITVPLCLFDTNIQVGLPYMVYLRRRLESTNVTGVLALT